MIADNLTLAALIAGNSGAWWMVLLLFSTGLAAGCLSAIAGAGGLLVLPLLLSLGVPPIQALATNKLQNVFGTASSTLNYFRRGHIDFGVLWPGMCCALIGSALGTLTVQRLDVQFLSWCIPVLLILIALYFLFSPRIGDSSHPPRLTNKQFSVLAGLTIGFYGGFFGPGIGAIFAFAQVSLLGYGLVQATAHTKPLVLATNVVSLSLFIVGGHVLWLLGAIMALGQIIGARLGSGFVMQRGTRLVRPMVIGVTLILAARLLWINIQAGY